MDNFKEFLNEFTTEVLYGWCNEFTPVQYVIAIIAMIAVLVFGSSLG